MLLETPRQDLRYGARTLRHNAGFTAISILALASWVPSRRAMRIDPLVALREQ